MSEDARQVLIIEASAEVRSILKENLEFSGFKVWPVADGKQCIDLLGEGIRPDVIVSDIATRGSAALQVVEKIRQSYPGIAFIAMTGSGVHEGKSFRECAIELGVDVVLEKPVNFEDLENSICSLMHF